MQAQGSVLIIMMMKRVRKRCAHTTRRRTEHFEFMIYLTYQLIFWNIFDLVIVISSLIPTGAGTSVVVLRLLRLMRLLRVISFIPEMRFVVEALIMSLRKSIYVLILIFVLLYIYAVAGVILFEQIENSRFTHVGEALLTLVQIMTLSSWETVMLPILDIYPNAWPFFISFVAISSIIVLNLFIAILVDVVSEIRRESLSKSGNK